MARKEKTLSIRVDTADREKLDAIAHSQGRNLSDQIRHWIRTTKVK